MKNVERQKQLDEQKYLLSESRKYDMSGKMDYCDYCIYCTDGKCKAEQLEREAKTICATAYNRQIRKK